MIAKTRATHSLYDAADTGTTMRAVAASLLAALFFSMTFILNRAVAVSGGHWQWAVSLRFIITVIVLGGYVMAKEGLGELPAEMRRHWKPWVLWSVSDFAIFASCTAWAARSGPAWLVAGGFQFTVIAGPLLAPLIYKDARRRIAPSTLGVGLLIFLGVMGMQYERMSHVALDAVLLPALAVFVAACVYPLGNRKLLVHLEECGAHVSVTQRVLGMNFLSLLWYIPLGVWTWFDIAPPTPHEVLLSSGIAVCSGVIATVLFFGATEKVRRHPVGLAAVEAMQSCALLFSILVGVFIMGEAWPHGIAAVGAAAVMLGIVLFSYLSYRAKVHPA